MLDSPKLFREIKKKLVLSGMLCKAFYLSRSRAGKCIFLMQTPVHENLGDQAIAIAEVMLLKEVLPDHVIVELPGNLVGKVPSVVKRIVRDAPVLIHGGGSIGTLWKSENDNREKIVQMFPNNRIIIFPQTIYYDSSPSGRAVLEVDKKLLGQHRDLWICTREKTSYELGLSYFPAAKLLLMPDIVLKMSRLPKKSSARGAVTAMRKDKEKILDSGQTEAILNILKTKFPDEPVICTDTIHSKYIYEKDRERLVLDKIELFSKARLVITDRLHGMIFAYLAKTPCVTFGVNNCKIRGVYEWIRQCSKIEFLDSTENLDSVIDRLISQAPADDTEDFTFPEFDALSDLLKQTYGESRGD